MSDSDLEEESDQSMSGCVTEEIEITSDLFIAVEEKLQASLLGKIRQDFEENFRRCQKSSIENVNKYYFPGYGGYGSMLASCEADEGNTYVISAEGKSSTGANEKAGDRLDGNGSVSAETEKLVYGTGDAEKAVNGSGSANEEAEKTSSGGGNANKEVYVREGVSAKPEKLSNGNGSANEKTEDMFYHHISSSNNKLKVISEPRSSEELNDQDIDVRMTGFKRKYLDFTQGSSDDLDAPPV